MACARRSWRDNEIFKEVNLKRIFFFQSILLSAAIILTACAPAATPPPRTQSAPTRAPTLVAAPRATATLAPPPTPGAFIPPTTCVANEFDSKCAYAQTHMLAVTIGTRVAGSPSGIRAGD